MMTSDTPPQDGPGLLAFRCRRCGDVYLDETNPVDYVRQYLESVKASMAASGFTLVHDCPSVVGGVGIADLVGGTLKGEQGT
jgi:hypothetical protein